VNAALKPVIWMFGSPATVVAAAIFGITLGTYGDDWLTHVGDWLRPVVSARGKVVSRDGDTVRIHLWATKKKENCRLTRVSAYSWMPERILRDANMINPFGKEAEERPVGVEVDLGERIIWPTFGAQSIVIYAQHWCEGRMVLSRALTLPLPVPNKVPI
jgi:hypothetical protein